MDLKLKTMAKDKKLGSEPAFMQSQIVNPHTGELGSDQMYDERMGMSKRFYAAVHIAAGLASNPNITHLNNADHMTSAYAITDMLLEKEAEDG